MEADGSAEGEEAQTSDWLELYSPAEDSDCAKEQTGFAELVEEEAVAADRIVAAGYRDSHSVVADLAIGSR